MDVIVYYINIALTQIMTKFNIGKPSKHNLCNENEQTRKQIKRTKEAKQRDNLVISKFKSDLKTLEDLQKQIEENKKNDRSKLGTV